MARQNEGNLPRRSSVGPAGARRRNPRQLSSSMVGGSMTNLGHDSISDAGNQSVRMASEPEVAVAAGVYGGAIGMGLQRRMSRRVSTSKISHDHPLSVEMDDAKLTNVIVRNRGSLAGRVDMSVNESQKKLKTFIVPKKVEVDSSDDEESSEEESESESSSDGSSVARKEEIARQHFLKRGKKSPFAHIEKQKGLALAIFNAADERDKQEEQEKKEAIARKYLEEKQMFGDSSSKRRKKGLAAAILKTAQERDELEAKEKVARQHWEEKQKNGESGPMGGNTRKKGLAAAILKTAQERDEMEAKEELARQHWEEKQKNGESGPMGGKTRKK
eukprot:CAMPEP_0198281604 /NCGR_PEP_ID=MMETSP1449-20131203/1525_1 /TAXON_ID=420275 /ORGANISM="Attheya septentrionalis, Strain CCMP2084" /LENGTH=330 /DNA_ID=CAMNT_0043977461 /DNA_START=63 /DNA_END=1052 /DNA_ORIENTATION=-